VVEHTFLVGQAELRGELVIRASITSSWDPNAERRLREEAMKNILERARRSVPSVTCPTHHSTHVVTWGWTGDDLGAAVEGPCCEEVQGALKAAVHRASL
jgi:hypothetical protein